MDSFKSAIWQDFCDRYQIAVEGVPLFRTEGDEVQVVEVGQSARRKVLARSTVMEAAGSMRSSWSTTGP